MSKGTRQRFQSDKSFKENWKKIFRPVEWDITKGELKYEDCRHPYTKQGCCDFCGKDLKGE